MRGDGMLTSKEAKNNANNHSLQACQSGTWGTIGGKLKVTQLSTTGYLGQFDFCA
ncbi:bacterial shufflon, constant region domain protein, partial [Escherichia coli 2-005-03_S1_C1]